MKTRHVDMRYAAENNNFLFHNKWRRAGISNANVEVHQTSKRTTTRLPFASERSGVLIPNIAINIPRDGIR